MTELAKVYQPKEVEERGYHFWEERGYFHAEPNPTKKPYSIVIPPPNVTGILHMGHALNNTIQDILIRWKRMQGYETLWMPGTDHAGIATQNVVEKTLAKEGKRRQDLGREAFVQRVWQWKEEYGSTIIRQLKKLGASCDWERTRFTMDEGLSHAVQEAFICLYHMGLIYRGNYIINWCPRCQTALSDEEAVHQEIEGKLYYIRYLVKNQSTRQNNDYIVVATTRPETLLGDVAVAIHPNDERFQHLKGATLILPVLGRELKLIEDDFVDPEFGTGAVKITPAHDPNDFAMGLRHNLAVINVMHSDGRMNEQAGDRYNGKDRFECRKEIIDQLQQEELLEKIETHPYTVGHCYRCHTIVEPRLSLQWFVKMKPLAKPAIRVVQEGKLKFYPSRWTKVYLQWLDNVRDWCISRQIWWGHRIPVWYCQNCTQTPNSELKRGINVPTKAGEIPQKCQDCGSEKLVQDEDVLDTWFSSWLWPFSTMGWTEKERKQKAESRRQKTEDKRENLLDYFYPTNTLVTAPEILFFWVARMVIAGFEFMGKEPFSQVYIHGTVRDISGKKMSKSLGNIIDPLDVIEHVGADALRFSLMTMAAQGTDIYLSEQKFDIGRNFTNKLWNASRFILLNVDLNKTSHQRLATSDSFNLPDRWILNRLQETIREVTNGLEGFQFNEVCRLIYEFFWHDFCDWYIEISKLRIKEPIVQEILLEVLEVSLRLLHPIMPFITEELWQKIEQTLPSIMITPWPEVDTGKLDVQAEKEMKLLIETVTTLRNLRTELNIPLDKKPRVLIHSQSSEALTVVQRDQEILYRLASIGEVCYDQTEKPEKQVAVAVVENLQIYLFLEGMIDLEAEKKRLAKQIETIEKASSGLKGRLKNEAFLTKAPLDVVEAEKNKLNVLEEKKERMKRHLIHL